MNGWQISINDKISDKKEMFLILENPMDKYTQIIELGKKNKGLNDRDKSDNKFPIVGLDQPNNKLDKDLPIIFE